MAQMKPARTYLAKAMPHPSGSGFAAQFAFPGVVPAYVLNGELPARYETADIAERHAAIVMRDALNARDHWTSKREHSYKPTGPEFAVLLAETGIYPGEFAYLWGTTQGRVMEWIDGTREVPFAMRWILKLLQDRNAYEAARTIASQYSTRKEAG